MRYITVGTAGHIDHGKTTLIKTLTGIDTSRHKEEKNRGMTIDLGFAFLPLFNDYSVSFIDVPGHEKFLKNMLAGITGIDSVVLVIAANEGIMPQTEEHMQIIKLLGISSGLIVITKTDLVNDKSLEGLIEEIKDKTNGLFIENSKIIKFSSVTGEGKVEIINYLKTLVKRIIPKESENITVFPVDRVFSKLGFGTIVTGTLFRGKIIPGDTLQVMPSGKYTKVKQIEIHGHKTDLGLSGQRLALRISGIEVSEVKRGNVFITPETYSLTEKIEVKINTLKEFEKGVRTNDRIRFYHFCSENIGRISILGKKNLLPGESSFAVIKFEQPVIAPFGTRFVVRNYSPLYLIGGGLVLNPYFLNNRENHEKRIKYLEYYENKKFFELSKYFLENINKIFKINELKSLIPIEHFDEIKNKLEKEKLIIQLGNLNYVSLNFYDTKKSELLNFISNFHKIEPQSNGLKKKEIQDFLKLDLVLLEYLIKSDEFSKNNDYYSLKGYTPNIFENDLNNILEILEKEKFLNFNDISELTGKNSEYLMNTLDSLISKNKIEKINGDIYILKSIWEETITSILYFINENKRVTTSQAREHLKTSRKYIIPILETLDQRKITKREEDFRVLFSYS